MNIRHACLGDASAIARVHVATWRTAYADIWPQALIDRLSIEERTRRWAEKLSEDDTGFVVFVAEDESAGVVGFASGGPERDGIKEFDGELQAIYLLKECQRQGVGRRLVAAVAGRLAAQGSRSMLVWVLDKNPSRRFYEALGGQPAASKQMEFGGETFGATAYGWPDIRVLCEAR